jgi:hypothetical protein
VRRGAGARGGDRRRAAPALARLLRSVRVARDEPAREARGAARRLRRRRRLLAPVDVTGFASEDGRLEAIGVAPSRYEGPTGIVGVLGEQLRAEGVAVLSLWAGLPHYISASPNPRGSLALVQKLASDLPLAIDEAPLRSEAAAFEQKISRSCRAIPSSPSTCGCSRSANSRSSCSES